MPHMFNIVKLYLLNHLFTCFHFRAYKNKINVHKILIRISINQYEQSEIKKMQRPFQVVNEAISLIGLSK